VSEIAAPRDDGGTIHRRLAEIRAAHVRDAASAGVARRVVYAAVVTYAAVFVFAAVLHFLAFKTAREDLGYMEQAMWSTLHGHFLESTTLAGHQMSRLGAHVDPFLVLLTPLYWLWSSPLLLVVFQALAVSSGALPVFWLARKHLESDRAAAHFALAYLLFPATQFNAFTSTSSFHSVAIAVPLILFTIWFLDEDRLVAFGVVAILAATTKEEIPLAVGCLGIWYAVRRGRRLFGAAVFGAGLALTLFDFLYVIPRFTPGVINPFASRYQGVGTTPSGVLRTLVTDPGAAIHSMTTTQKGIYLCLLLAPFLGLWLLEPLLFLGAVPDLGINMLSSFNDQTRIAFHWTAGIIPFTIAASIFGAAKLKRHANAVSLGVFAATAVLGAYTPLFFIGEDLTAFRSQANDARNTAIAAIPSDARVSASNRLGSHLSGRRYIYIFPKVGSARWIVADRNDKTYLHFGGAFKRAIVRYESSPEWHTVFSSDGVVVLRKRDTP
jgi:uncharacterized membrane protein